MKYLMISLVLLGGCASTQPYYAPKPKIDIPDLPVVAGAGKTVVVPNKKLTDTEKDKLIVQMRKSEKANAEGYLARGRAFNSIKRIYQGN